MASQKTNKIIEITADEFGTLELIDSGLLGSFKRLVNKSEFYEVVRNKELYGELMPYAYSFAPSQPNASKIIQKIKKGDEVLLSYNSQIVGKIEAEETYTLKEPDESIFTAKNICILNNLDNAVRTAIAGEFSLQTNKLKDLKNEIKERILNLNAKKVTALMITADPFNRMHENMIRIVIDKADFVVIFLVRTFSSDGRLDFDLRLECLEYICDNYLPRERIAIVPLSNTTLFSDHINPVLEAIASKNIGANKIVVGQNHTGLGMHFDQNQANTLLDKYAKLLNLELIVLPRMFYCDLCHTIVSSKSCPHGDHHHIKYNTNTIKKLLFAGIIPPTILMRPQISAIILERLFKERFSGFEKICADLFANCGIIENHTQKEFYENLMKLYQTTYLS